MYDATVYEGTNFLSYLFEGGEKYGYIAGASSALSSILPTTEGKTFGQNKVVSRLLKGVFKERPSFPKHVVIYDASIVLKYIHNL